MKIGLPASTKLTDFERQVGDDAVQRRHDQGVAEIQFGPFLLGLCLQVPGVLFDRRVRSATEARRDHIDAFAQGDYAFVRRRVILFDFLEFGG